MSELTADDVRTLVKELLSAERRQWLDRNLALYDELKKLRAAFDTNTAELQSVRGMLSKIPTIEQFAALRTQLEAACKSSLPPMDAIKVIAKLEGEMGAALEEIQRFKKLVAQDMDDGLAQIRELYGELVHDVFPPEPEAPGVPSVHYADRREPKDLPIPTEHGRAFLAAVEQPGALARHHHQTHDGMLLIARVMARHCDAQGMVTMGLRELAERAPVANVTAKRGVARLVESGFLVPSHGPGQSRSYRLMTERAPIPEEPEQAPTPVVERRPGDPPPMPTGGAPLRFWEAVKAIPHSPVPAHAVAQVLAWACDQQGRAALPLQEIGTLAHLPPRELQIAMDYLRITGWVRNLGRVLLPDNRYVAHHELALDRVASEGDAP